MSEEYAAAEVRAAGAGKAPRPAAAEIIPVHAPVGPALDALLEEIIDAEEVFLIGVLPWECSRRLIELQERRLAAGAPPPRKVVHYFIPERDAKSAGATMGPRIQRWVAGLFGVRNWVVPNRDESQNRDTLMIHLYQDEAGGRVVLTRRGSDFRAATLAYLPLAQLPSDGVLTVARFSPGETERIREQVMGDLLVNARPWDIRQVRCYGPQFADNGDPHSFFPRLSRLTDQRKIKPRETEPAVVVAVCGHTSRGPVVVLKRRHRSNSIDDFDVLSLISEHIVVEDLVTWFKRIPGPLDPHDERAAEQIWVAAGRPKQIVLEQQFFAEAAQRELFLSCGLNVEAERLRFRGYRLVERDDESHLGFAVYRLDLIQDDDLDEFEIVRRWSPDLIPVPIDRLYDSPENLNRLLRLQRNWLMENVFADSTTQPEPERP